MKVRIDDNDPCRYWVTSESEPDVEYIVDICEFPIGLDAEGIMDFNGSCGLAGGIRGCNDFAYRCHKALKDPANQGKFFRCKHIQAAEKYALRLLKPHMKKHRPNLHEDLQA